MIISNSDSNSYELSSEYKAISSELTVNTLNQRGTEFMENKIQQFLSNDDQKILVIRFEKQTELTHFKYIKQYLNSFETSNYQENREKPPKLVLIIIHKPITRKTMKKKTQFDSGITFGYPQADWEYSIIENLSGSNYRYLVIYCFN